jgi:hypothetical protein
MHSQELSSLEEKSEAVALYGLRELSLIGLAANLNDPLCRRKLSMWMVVILRRRQIYFVTACEIRDVSPCGS